MLYPFVKISFVYLYPSASIPKSLRENNIIKELVYYSDSYFSGRFVGSLFVAYFNNGIFQYLVSNQIGNFLRDENLE